MSQKNIYRRLILTTVIELVPILFLFFGFFVTLIAALFMTFNQISESSTVLNKSYTAWVEDGIIETQTILNTYGDKQPDKTSYSVFNGMLKLVISKDELIDEKEFNQIEANSILKV